MYVSVCVHACVCLCVCACMCVCVCVCVRVCVLSNEFSKFSSVFKTCMNMYVYLFYVSCFTMKDTMACEELMLYLLKEDTSPCIFNLGTTVMIVVTFMLAL